MLRKSLDGLLAQKNAGRLDSSEKYRNSSQKNTGWFEGHLLYEKLKREEKTAESKGYRDFFEKTTNLKNSLVQYEQVFDLLFMRDLIHLLMHISKEL